MARGILPAMVSNSWVDGGTVSFLLGGGGYLGRRVAMIGLDEAGGRRLLCEMLWTIEHRNGHYCPSQHRFLISKATDYYVSLAPIDLAPGQQWCRNMCSTGIRKSPWLTIGGLLIRQVIRVSDRRWVLVTLPQQITPGAYWALQGNHVRDLSRSFVPAACLAAYLAGS